MVICVVWKNGNASMSIKYYIQYNIHVLVFSGTAKWLDIHIMYTDLRTMENN